MEEKILIIDSHPVYISKLEGFFRGLSYKNIALTKSGKEGLEHVQGDQPDLVVLSAMLPDIDSAIVCKKIKELSGSTKVIVQIGLFTDDSTVRKLKAAGANATLIRKEKDLQPLQDIVEGLLK